MLVSRYNQVARLDGRDLTHRMHVTDIWTRRESRWQIVRRHATVAELMTTYASPQELEAGLDHLRAAPRDEGVVELIVRRPAVDEREVVEEAELDLEDGLVGDSWRSRGRSGGRPSNTKRRSRS